MNRRVLAAVAVAALVVLAGCGGGVEQEPTTETTDASPGGTTPADTATPGGATPTATPDTGLEDVTLPAGVTEDGVTNRSALLSAHDGALGDTPVTVSMDFRLEINGSGQNVSFLGKVTPGDDRGWIRVDLQDGVGTYYTEGGTTYRKVVQNGETTYGTTESVSAIPQRTRFGADVRIGDALGAANWTATGVVERNGTRMIRMAATDVSLPDSVNVSGDAVTESRGVLLVDERGIVHHVSIYTRVETGDRTVVYEIEVSLRDVGSTTIARPDWVETA